MNICSIGRRFYEITEIDFNSTRTIFDFDAVFIDAAGLMDRQKQNPLAIEFRRNEFAEFLALNRTIVVFTAPLPLEVYLPIEPVKFDALAGSKVDFKGSDQLKVFWQSVRQDMQFLAYFITVPGQPFLFVAATNKPVASLVRHERGHLVLLPWLKQYPNSFDNQKACQTFNSAFRKLNEHLSPIKSTAQFPAWSTHYGWKRECELRANLISLQTEADELSKQIRAATVELEAEDRLKVLFTGKGDILVETVISVLKELGAKAAPGEPGRDDIVLEFQGKHAVLEVKGKKSSAAESDAAQLEKWVAGFKERTGTDPKGILLVNAFCGTTLSERTEPAFPDQMLKYSIQREHCLMTTTQLLGVLLEARSHPEKRVDLVNGLFSTVGVHSQFTDCRNFLSASSTGAPAV